MRLAAAILLLITLAHRQCAQQFDSVSDEALVQTASTWSLDDAINNKGKATHLVVEGQDNAANRKWWAEFKHKYAKEYKDLNAEGSAKKAFMQNLKQANLMNADPSVSFQSGLNEYSDMTYADIKSVMLLKNNPKQREVITTDTGPVPDDESTSRKLLAGPDRRSMLTGYPRAKTVDYIFQKRVAPARQQGLCGSCWAFAALLAIEINWHLDTKNQYSATTSPQLSEQQLIDCMHADYGYYSVGCWGGYSDEVFEYAAAVNITSEGRYPYRGFRNAGCANYGDNNMEMLKLNPTSPVIYPVQNSTLDLMSAVNLGAVVTYVEVTPAFMSYQSGIFSATSSTYGPLCGTNVNHAMVIVGYVWRGDFPGSYWVLQNSWGPTWGESGRMRIEMEPPGPGACGMYMYTMQPTRGFNSTFWN